MLVVALLLIVNTVTGLGVQPAAGDGDHAAGRRLQLLHPDAVHPGGGDRGPDRRGLRLRTADRRQVLPDRQLARRTKIALINFIGWDAVFKVLPLLLAVGVLMPAVAAFFTLRKYLKV